MHPAHMWEDKAYVDQASKMYEESAKPQTHPTYYGIPEYGSSVEHVGGLSTVETMQSRALRSLPAPTYHPPGYSGVPPLLKQPFPWGDVNERLVAIELGMHEGDEGYVTSLVNEFRPWFLALRKRCPVKDLTRLTELDTRLMAIEEWLGKYTNPGAFGYSAPHYVKMMSTSVSK